MARIKIQLAEPALVMTLKAVMEAEGHTVSETNPDICFADIANVHHVDESNGQVILAVTATEIPQAVEAMKKGVWGYILLPLQPGEAGMAVRRAALSGSNSVRDENAAPESLKSLEAIESDYIQFVLRMCKNNQAKAARILGIGRNTLWRKLKKIHDWHTNEGGGTARSA